MSVTITGRSLIASSLRLIGALAQGETAPAADESEAFDTLNQLVDGWATQQLTILTIGRHVFTPTANVSTYAIGPTGVTMADGYTDRPTEIVNAGLVLNTATPAIEIPLTPLTDDDYAAIGIKALTSIYPTEFYYNPTMPTGTLFLWPTPNTAANTIAIYTPDALAQFADLTTPVTLAPAYARALRYSLAVDLAAEFGKEPPNSVIGIANAAFAELKTQNLKLSVLSLDEMYLDHFNRFSTYNAWTNTGQ
jgi:hypothetical protein